MAERQLAIFDYVEMRVDDSVLYQIKSLAPGAVITFDQIQIKRTEKFYIVSKTDEFEQVFSSFDDCYNFVRLQISDQLNKKVDEEID